MEKSQEKYRECHPGMASRNNFKEYLERIAKNDDISVGTVTNIIKEASLQEEYHDIELLGQLAVIMREYGLEPNYCWIGS